MKKLIKLLNRILKCSFNVYNLLGIIDIILVIGIFYNLTTTSTIFDSNISFILLFIEFGILFFLGYFLLLTGIKQFIKDYNK